MHGCSLRNAHLVNAEVDSMGGVVDSGVEVGEGSSLQRAAIEKAQAELRREYDMREESKRELEFLEKGGDPLDFKSGNAETVSVQSTSLTDQPPEQLVTSEARGSFALTASPQGDSVESSGRPEAPLVSEPNSADNLLLFDGENDPGDGERDSLRFVRSKIAGSEHTTQLDTSQRAKELCESAGIGLPKSRAYKRRNRSRPNREGARSSLIDVVPTRGEHMSTFPSRPGQKDVKSSAPCTDNSKDQNALLNHDKKPTISNGIITPTDLPPDSAVDMDLGNGKGIEPTELVPKIVLGSKRNMVDSQRSEAVGIEPPEVFSELRESIGGARADCISHLEKPVNQSASAQQNGYLDAKGDEGRVVSEGQICSTNLNKKGLDSESYCTATSLSLHGTSDSVPLNGSRSEDFHEKTGAETLILSASPNRESDEKLKAKSETEADDGCCSVMDERSSICESDRNNSSLKPKEELHERGSGSQEEVKHTIGDEEMNRDGITASQIEGEVEITSTGDLDPAKESVCSDRFGGSTEKPVHDIPSSEKEVANDKLKDPSFAGLHSQTSLLCKGSPDTVQHKISTETNLKVDARAHEDSILKEARIIEAKRKRIAQLSVGAFTSENHQKSHWDFVLEEMAWLANDFAQERLWKISAAAQLSHRISSASRARLTEKSSLREQKKVAHILSKAIMEFWLSAEELSKGTATQYQGRNSVRGVQEYALRYMKYNTTLLPLCSAESPHTPESIYDLESQELSWKEWFSEENLFFTALPGSMETYRKSIESHLLKVERTGGSIQEEVETSICDAAAVLDHGSQGNGYEADEGEKNTALLSRDAENGKPTKLAQKKRNLIKFTTSRSSDVGANPPLMQRMENKFGTHPSAVTVKRPADNLHGSSIPTKRMRTASRPRFTTPFTAGTSGAIQVLNKTDASSGDTNSFQDDQSTFQGGSQIPDNMEVESVADFSRQSPFDAAEVSKPKKKKKPKHPGSGYEQRWQLESNFQNDLGGYPRKRLDRLVESNGSNGLYGQPIVKKQKMIRQPMDNSLDNYSPLAGSIPSPVASQMSNMSNSNKLVKILGGRDRGRKSKLKFVGREPEGPWSSFEEQALIVLVHDLGPNWGLISDAINNILQYKCIFRKPEECSEHHKELISRTTGDGAESAEDSGSSQPYPSTLPGIPKGSARALFQRLQDPIEEDMIKFHFEKIIRITQRLHYVKMQNENREQKPIQPHSSHALALSQVCPNNVNAGPGPLLTPLDLCDTTDPSPDVLSGGYQGTHGGSLAISNQGSAASMHPASSSISALQGSPNMLGNNFSSPSAPVNSTMRDGRYGVPRSASLSVDEHQRVHQYNQMMPGRVSGTAPGTDRGVRMMAGSSGIGMSGMNRNMAMGRPGFPGIATSSVLNSGSMLPSNMAVLAEPANMLRPRDPSNMMRPAQVPEHQRQIMGSDHQMQGTRGNIQGVPPFGSFLNQTASPSSQTHTFHQQQQLQSSPQHPHLQGANHISSAQQQAYAIRLAKERHVQLQQQRLLQQQQLAASGGIMPRGPPQPQASLQNSSLVQPSPSAPLSAPLSPSSSSVPPMSQHQQKPHVPPHGLTRNSQAGGNQMGKQRQKQLQQNSNIQAGRHHPQQRPHPQQNPKLARGAGRGSVTTHQNLNVESPSILNGLSPGTSGQSLEKGEQVMSMMQAQALYPVSGLSTHHPSNKSLAQQQKLYSSQSIATSKQSQQVPSHLDNGDQGHVSPSTSGNVSTSQRAGSPSVTSSSNTQQLQSTQKLGNQTQPPVQRVLHKNRQMNSDSLPKKFLADQGQSEQLHVSSSSGPSHLGTAALGPQPSIELGSLKPASSTSGTQLKSSEKMQNSMESKPVKVSPPIRNPLSSLKTTQSQGSGDGKVSVSMPSQGLDVGTQGQLQLQKSSSASQQEQLSLPAQQLPAGNNNSYTIDKSTDNRLE